MVLEKEFQVKINSLMDEFLTPHRIQTYECDKQLWNYRYDDDFKYGQKAGEIIGMILGYYIAKYNKCPSDEDMVEMNKMIESRKDDIKKSFSDIRLSDKA